VRHVELSVVRLHIGDELLEIFRREILLGEDQDRRAGASPIGSKSAPGRRPDWDRVPAPLRGCRDDPSRWCSRRSWRAWRGVMPVGAAGADHVFDDERSDRATATVVGNDAGDHVGSGRRPQMAQSRLIAGLDSPAPRPSLIRAPAQRTGQSAGQQVRFVHSSPQAFTALRYLIAASGNRKPRGRKFRPRGLFFCRRPERPACMPCRLFGENLVALAADRRQNARTSMKVAIANNVAEIAASGTPWRRHGQSAGAAEVFLHQRTQHKAQDHRRRLEVVLHSQ